MMRVTIFGLRSSLMSMMRAIGTRHAGRATRGELRGTGDAARTAFINGDDEGLAADFHVVRCAAR